MGENVKAETQSLALRDGLESLRLSKGVTAEVGRKIRVKALKLLVSRKKNERAPDPFPEFWR